MKDQTPEIDSDLEQRTGDMWRYVRENRNSLDSERACKMILAGFDAAVANVQKKLDEAISENGRLYKECRKLKKLAHIQTTSEGGQGRQA